jgi:uracil-DNA glycosylase
MSYRYENLIKGVKKSWLPMFKEIFDNEKGKKLFDYLSDTSDTIYPKPEHVFNAFKFFEKDKLSIVLLGQDPYIRSETHDGEIVPQAMGLSFSVDRRMSKVPPSLKNIYKEMKTSHPDFEIPKHGDLTDWVKNNKMLLLNAALTVKEGKSNSHQKKWMKFTDQMLEYISDNTKGIIFILLGNFAKKKVKFLDIDSHIIINGTHPSPLSASNGFFGSNIFKRVDRKLKELDKEVLNLKLA